MKKPVQFMAMVALPDAVREFLLETYKPAHKQVWAQQVTLAYGVDRSHELPHGPVTITVLGRCIGETVDALLVSVNRERYVRHDGHPLFVTLSTQPGVRPGEARNLDWSHAELYDSCYQFGPDYAMYASLVPVRLNLPGSRRATLRLKKVA